MQGQDSETLIDLSSDSNCTMVEDFEGAQKLQSTDLSMHEERFLEFLEPELEKCAENGWIEILETPKEPYDCDNDPAGLYGGREVDDRPSLLEFYHQDARTNGIFARMAPMKEDLVAAAATKSSQMLSDYDDQTVKNAQFQSKFPTLKAQRSYAEILSKTSFRRHSDSPKPALQSYSTQRSKKEKALLVLDAWQKGNDARNKSKEDEELQKAIHMSKAMKAKEDSELQMAVLASKALEAGNQARFQDALRTSASTESSKRKREGSKDSDSGGLENNSNLQKASRSSITPDTRPRQQKAAHNSRIARSRPSKTSDYQSSIVQKDTKRVVSYQSSPLEPFLWSQSRIH